MCHSNCYTRFTGIALLLGGIMPIIGMAMRPLLVEQNFNFQPADFTAVGAQHGIWILSYQVMVFGLFVRLAGLVALGSLHSHTPARTVVWPGVAIGMAGMMALMAMPLSHTVFLPFDIAIAVWLVVLGG